MVAKGEGAFTQEIPHNSILGGGPLISTPFHRGVVSLVVGICKGLHLGRQERDLHHDCGKLEPPNVMVSPGVVPHDQI